MKNLKQKAAFKREEDKRKNNGGARPGTGPKKKNEMDKVTSISFSVRKSLIDTEEKREAFKDHIYQHIDDYEYSMPLKVEVTKKKPVEGVQLEGGIMGKKLKKAVFKK